MRRIKWELYSLTTGLVLALAPQVVAQSQQTPPSQQQDIVEAARKAREQKKQQPKAKVVYSNDNLPGTGTVSVVGQATEAPSGARASGETAVAKGGEAAARAEAADKPGGLNEAEWRKKFSDLRNKIATAEKEADILQRELNLNMQQYYSDPNKALREQYSRNEINDGRSKTDAKKQEIVQLKQQLSDLEDQLRKAGGPPAWSRE